MKEKTTTDLEILKNMWDTILDYEKHNYQERKDGQIPVNQLINYFGYKNICKIFGCSIVSTPIAKELIKESFK